MNNEQIERKRSLSRGKKTMNEFYDVGRDFDESYCSSSRVKTMILFANGNIAAFDENDQQIGELQCKSAIQLWAEFATKLGYDVEGCECRMQASGGPGLQVVLDAVGVNK